MMLARAVLVLALIALTGAARADIPGLSAVLARPGLRYIVVGELHGTEEMPAFFGDLVAEVTARRPVMVVLEYPEQWGRDLDRYLASPGDEAARKTLLSTNFWTRWRDGRSSRAMFALVEKLRSLRVPVTACQPSGNAGDPAGYERVMGACWMQAADAPKYLTLILAGDAHASFTPVYGDIMTAAAQLPREQTISLDDLSAPGWSWHCETADKCGEYPSHAGDTRKPRGIYLDPAFVPVELGTYDGVYATGPHFTASPPAVSAP